MRQILESDTNFQDISNSDDAIKLLKVIISMTYNYLSQRYVSQTISEAWKKIKSVTKPRIRPFKTALCTWFMQLSTLGVEAYL
jgi:hypothetical protein